MSIHSSILPDEKVFADFRRQCLSSDNWVNKYDSNGMQVWVEVPAKKGKQGPKVHKIKCKMPITDVSAATMYDVLHDSKYRKEWDPAMLESFDIARLSDNADVGYYSWQCPTPMTSRDVVSLRSWQVKDDEYVIVNFSVKHPRYPPGKKTRESRLPPHRLSDPGHGTQQLHVHLPVTSRPQRFSSEGCGERGH